MAFFGYAPEGPAPGEERLRGWEALKMQMPGETWGGLALLTGLNMLANNRGQNIGSQIGNAALGTLNAWEGYQALKRQEAEKAAELEREQARQAIEDERWERKFTREGEVSDRDYALQVAKFNADQAERKAAAARAWAGINANRAAQQRAAEEAAAKEEWEKTHGIGSNGEPIVFDPATNSWVLDESRVYRDKDNNIIGYAQGVPGPKEEKPKELKVSDYDTIYENYNKATSDFQAVSESLNSMLELMQDPSPADDVALVYAYMKGQDPRSVVRESEFDMAQGTGGVMDKVMAKLYSINGSGILTDDQRANLVRATYKKYKASLRGLQDTNKKYREYDLPQFGIDPKGFLYEPTAMYGNLDARYNTWQKSVSDAESGYSVPGIPSGSAPSAQLPMQAPVPIVQEIPMQPIPQAPTAPIYPASPRAAVNTPQGGPRTVQTKHAGGKVVMQGGKRVFVPNK